ncbi:MAG: class 1 fructose-bisphosphatase [Candidatus Brocadia sp. WS118]|nr:MAG: class 1 fructose-bisphosphatase [Candidatus Brocadia sp. WS118]
MQQNKGITIQRHIVEQERAFPQATGDFTGLLWDLSIAAKIISREVNKAGLAEILGLTGEVNVHGEAVKKLDVYANERICKSMDHGGHLCIMASEENEDVITIPDEFPKGKYVLMFDPLDGSSNIDANVSVGTIFSIYRRKTTGKEATVEDCLRKGTEQVAAGYIVYGSSTMMVYTTGQGVYGFTLDPSIGEFLLSHENIKIPAKGKTYSINEGNTHTWDEGTRRYIGYLKESDSSTGRPYSLRYIGSLVADFHRNLLYGGIFLYPADYKDQKKPKSKLRLLYEAAPLAFIVEQAGGMASTGRERIMDIQSTELHQKVPLVIGSKEDVLIYEKFFNQK